ncbi:MAG: GspH/FimT family pseudopilin [Rhodocyclaceae bacterium]|nr:GspH/FimT family pseudopilin [Rhodocyclaceae bacterium]
MLNETRPRGVSLIEGLIVVALVAILLVLAAPAIGDWLANSRIRTAGESLLAGLQLARMEAVRRNAIVEFALGPGTGFVVRTQAGEVIQQRAAAEGSADVVATTTPNGTSIVSFDGLGRRVANLDGSPSIDRIDLDLPAAVLPPERTRNLRLVVGMGGQIVFCDPNVTAADDVRRCP